MGEEEIDPSDSAPSLEIGIATLSAEEIAGTWCRPSKVALRGDATPREATAPTERPPPPGRPARFTVVRELGRGGMGKVDEVFDSVLGRSVAQKSVLPGAGLLPTTLLISEAQTCAQLEHPSIVPIYDLGPNVDGDPQYTMRRVRGRTLGEVLANASPDGLLTSLAQRIGVLRQVCLAVAYAHQRGVVHRDLKPDNVICGEFGEVYVLDWGIAHLVEGSDVKRTTHDEVQAGSPGYMAPEQVLSQPISPATDVFALGAMLYEIVTGHRAFNDADMASIVRRCTTGLEGPPSSRSKHVPNVFDSLVMRCLSIEPERRPSAREIADTIDAFLDGERARLEREGEAESFANEAEEAVQEFRAQTLEARTLRQRAEEVLEKIPTWESAEQKEAGWELLSRADDSARLAAVHLAKAQAAFVRALGRVPEHPRSRRGLSKLHFELFESAEREGDNDGAAQHLDLARRYDDGQLALELANEGVLLVEPSIDVTLSISKYERDGLRLVLGPKQRIRANDRVRLGAGSYVVFAERGSGHLELRYPIRIARARVHRLKLRVPDPEEIPDGFIVIPGGPFLGALNRNGTRFGDRTLPDFAIGRFPVRLREYTEFLDALGHDAERRLVHGESAIVVRDVVNGSWRLTDYAIEGAARARVPREQELELPAFQVSWYDAVAFARWKAETSGFAVRLPTELEWEKALRGADGRRFSMGDRLDASFAKLRESRPEVPQHEPVGAFPLDDSPYGVRDLTGGVGDWTQTMADDGDVPTMSDEGKADADVRQAVWRGGCFGTTALFPHAMRYTQAVKARVGWIGFRLALSLDSNGSSSLEVEPMRRQRQL